MAACGGSADPQAPRRAGARKVPRAAAMVDADDGTAPVADRAESGGIASSRRAGEDLRRRVGSPDSDARRAS